MARPEDKDGEVSLFDSIKRAVGPLVGDLVEKAVEALPECFCCNGKAVPFRCIICGSYTCKDHGYHRLGKRDSICRPCLMVLLGESVGVCSSAEAPDPWEVLGVPEDATKSQVERAFRLRAKDCHPDRFPDDKAKAAEFRRIQWAREAVLGSM